MERKTNLWDAWTELSTVEGYRTYGSIPCVCVTSPCDCGFGGTPGYFPPNNPQPWEPDFPWEPPTSPHHPSNTDVIPQKPWVPGYLDPDREISLHERDGSTLAIPAWGLAAIIFLLVVKS